MATKILLEEVGPLQVLGLRLAIGLPLLAGLIRFNRVRFRVAREDAWPLAAGGAILTAHFLIQIAGLTMTTATNTAWIIAVTPLALAVLSFAFLHERLGRAGLAGIAIATAGILLLVSRGRLTDIAWLRSTGDWLALTSAFTWAGYTVVTRNLVRRCHPLIVSFGVFLIAAVLIVIPFAATTDVRAVLALSMPAVLSLLFLAIGGLVIGNWCWQIGVARLGATRAGLYLYLEPLSTLALAIPLLGESFGLAAAAGAGLVLAGVYLGQRSRP